MRHHLHSTRQNTFLESETKNILNNVMIHFMKQLPLSQMCREHRDIAIFSGEGYGAIAIFSSVSCGAIAIFSGVRCGAIAIFSGVRCGAIAIFSVQSITRNLEF